MQDTCNDFFGLATVQDFIQEFPEVMQDHARILMSITLQELARRFCMDYILYQSKENKEWLSKLGNGQSKVQTESD